MSHEDHAHVFRWDRPDVLKCDFCSTTDGLMWMEITDEFTLAPTDDLPAYVDDGGWIACQTCHEHIEAGDRNYIRQKLVDQIAAHRKHNPGKINVAFTVKWHYRMTYAFFRHRRGSIPFG